MKLTYVAALAAFLLSSVPAMAAQGDAREAMLARARAAELPGEWVPAPGDPLSHHIASYAKQICSGVFVSGMAPELVRATLGDRNVLARLDDRIRADPPEIDRERREVRITADGITRAARHLGDQGCVTLPANGDELRFRPMSIPRASDAHAPWPIGDRVTAEVPAGIDRTKLAAAIDAAFLPADGLTQAFVVTWRGQLIGERYGLGANATTPLEGWSMGKSVVATLIGVLIEQGAYRLDQPAPIPEWAQTGDPRQAIRIRDILQMSSGLRIRAQQDPEYVDDGSYPDHWYYYSSDDAFAYAASRPLQWPPATIGRYRNTDPVLASYLVRLAVEARGEDYHLFPQRALFDRLGIRTAVLEMDASGNFLTQGYELMSGRDWARLGNLYLQDGMWEGERILPEGYARFVSTLAPAWAADGRPIYGGFFWINGDGFFPIPEDAYFMAGAGGQFTFVIPSYDLVVTRVGRWAGEQSGIAALRRALALLMEAVPANR